MTWICATESTRSSRRPLPHRCGPAGGRSGCCTAARPTSTCSTRSTAGSWCSEASAALSRPAAASFKHVSPAGAAVAGPVDEVTAELYGIDRDRRRRTHQRLPAGPRRRSEILLRGLRRRLAPGRRRTRRAADPAWSATASSPPATLRAPLTTLGKKKNGRFLVMEADETYTPPQYETREVSGLRLTQQRDEVPLSTALLDDVVCGTLPSAASEDLLLGLVVLRYTQSNSVCYLRDGDDPGDRRRPAVPGGLHPAGRGEDRHLVAATPPGGPRTRLPARTSGVRTGSTGRSASSRAI